MMRCLLTGSCGFMGSHLHDQLVRDGHDVMGIDNLSTGFLHNRNKIGETRFLDLVNDKEAVARKIMSFRPEIVFATAAWAHEGLSAFCPVRITENNYNATLNTLIPSIKSGVKRFVFFSSMSVYGAQNPPFNEEMERKPVDVYAVAKTASERAIELLSSVHGFDYTIIRPHNVYGPRQSLSDPYRNVVGIFMRRALQGKPLIVYGDGKQKRSFSYIYDVTPPIARAGFEPRASRQIINIGPTEEYSINELAEEVIRVSGSKAGIEHIPDRPLEVKNAWCTNDKAMDILGYKTMTPFSEGIEKMFHWAKQLNDSTGIATPRYLDSLEIVSENTPKTWTERSL